MKPFLIAGVLAAVAVSAWNTEAIAADVGVSLNIGQPGFYGQINIGGYPQPQLLYRRPIAIGRVPVDRPPIYLHVPPRQAKNWRKYCRNYNACGERVYFVQRNWYNREYVPRFQENQRRGHNEYQEQRRNDQGLQRRNEQPGHRFRR